MKLLLVCNNLGLGGAERVHVNLANGFAERGEEVYLAADLTQVAKGQAYPVNEKVKILSLCPKETNKYIKWGKGLLRLRKYIREYRPDVVIGNNCFSSLLSRLAACGTGIPVILTIHNALESKTFHFSKSSLMMNHYLPRIFSMTTVLTEADRKFMEEHYHNHRITVMPNPCTFKPVKSLPENKEHLVIAAGRLNEWGYKGWDILIKAWHELTLHHPDCILSPSNPQGWRLELAGRGSSETVSLLHKWIDEAGINESVKLIGQQSHISEIFQRASIYCLSSRSEGLPMVVIEAMSQGCAIVATDFKGRTRELIGDTAGLLSQPEDAQTLAEHLYQVISNEAQRKVMQEAAIKRSAVYSVNVVLDRWYDLFKHLHD